MSRDLVKVHKRRKARGRDGVDLSHMAQFIQVGDDGVSRVAVIAPSMVSSGRLSPLACFYIPSSTYTHISRNKADSEYGVSLASG